MESGGSILLPCSLAYALELEAPATRGEVITESRFDVILFHCRRIRHQLLYKV